MLPLDRSDYDALRSVASVEFIHPGEYRVRFSGAVRAVICERCIGDRVERCRDYLYFTLRGV